MVNVHISFCDKIAFLSLSFAVKISEKILQNLRRQYFSRFQLHLKNEFRSTIYRDLTWANSMGPFDFDNYRHCIDAQMAFCIHDTTLMTNHNHQVT